jgi:putative SOS response-associated peptidase YedK
MCGRFVRKTSALQVAEAFTAQINTDELAISFNVAPTSRVLAVVSESNTRSLVNFSWGLIPRWAPDSSRAASMINARVETVAEKPSFRDLVSKNRCVLPMDGYFEWREQLSHDETKSMKSVKQPFYFSANLESGFSHNGVLAVAGLWTSWKDPNQANSPVLHTVVALTTDANDMVGEIHHRMPVLLDEQGVESWLDAGTQSPLGELELVPNDALVVCAVSTKVNSSRNNGSELIKPIVLTKFEPVDELKLF